MSDVLVVGAGIAGAAVGYFLSGSARVTVLEMEVAPGRHATGRSAALFSEYFGAPLVRALTTASRRFLAVPPPGFAEHPLLTPRGAVTVALPGAEEDFDAALAAARTVPGGGVEVAAAQLAGLWPAVEPDRYARVLHKPAVMDVDVAALHHGFLRGLRTSGGTVLNSAPVTGLRRDGGGWVASTPAGDHAAAVLVNAAGAWADRVAVMAGAVPVGLVPRRRTALLADVDADTSTWPLLNDVPETFYAKPESGSLLVSPADAEPAEAGDPRARDLDVAIGVDRLERATTLRVRRVRHSWAGLRTSAADDLPVLGADPAVPGLFWLAGLGGYGVQLSPAAGRLVAAEVLGARPGPDLPPTATRELAPGRPGTRAAR